MLNKQTNVKWTNFTRWHKLWHCDHACYKLDVHKIHDFNILNIMVNSSCNYARRKPDSMSRSIIWTSPTHAAACSGVRRSWSCGEKKPDENQWWHLISIKHYNRERWSCITVQTQIHFIHTSALTSSFLCNNNWTSSALRLKMAWTRGGCRYGNVRVTLTQTLHDMPS